MSEPIPESIPISVDPRSRRPLKKARRLPPSASATASQANAIDTLFLDPERPVSVPDASKAKTSASLPAPPEIVANVQGSSAGAGSGEFHVYKASRRREYERMRLMDEEARQEAEDERWAREERERRERDDAKTRKNREKRNRRKKAAATRPAGRPQSVSVEPEGGKDGNGGDVDTGDGNTKPVRKPLEVKMPTRADDDVSASATAAASATTATDAAGVGDSAQEVGITILEDD